MWTIFNTARIHRASLFLLLMVFMSCGGGDKKSVTKPDPPRATSISVSQSSISMSYVGQSTGVTATVLDQFQRTFNATVTWSSDDPSVATVSGGGLVTSVADGMTTVRATSGSLSASVSVTVQRVAVRVSKISGDGQTGQVGEVLPEPLVVRAEDAGGSPMPGASVTFTSGTGGSVIVTEATADGQALASTTWTLGTTSGSQLLTAAIPGSPVAPAQFSATASAGPLAAIAKASGDQQVVPVGFAVFEPVTIQADGRIRERRRGSLGRLRRDRRWRFGNALQREPPAKTVPSRRPGPWEPWWEPTCFPPPPRTFPPWSSRRRQRRPRPTSSPAPSSSSPANPTSLQSHRGVHHRNQ